MCLAKMPLASYWFLRTLICGGCVGGLPSSFLFCLWHLCPCPAVSVLSPHCGCIFKSLLCPRHLHYGSDKLQSLSLKKQKQHNSKNLLDSHMPLKLLTPLSLPLTALLSKESLCEQPSLPPLAFTLRWYHPGICSHHPNWLFLLRS